jgi:16S rRNA (cytidine1402-2'-O)-methyltransferase
MAAETKPVVLFISPHRLLGDLEALEEAFGPDREIAVTRELTKLHEEVWVGRTGAAVDEWSGREVKGEFTVVVAPGHQDAISPDDAISEARALVASGSTPSEAARRVAASTGVSRKPIYRALIEDQERS